MRGVANWRGRARSGTRYDALSIPVLAGAWTIESTGIEFACSVGTQLRLAVYSLVGLFGLCCLVEISFTSIGLKGEWGGGEMAFGPVACCGSSILHWD